MISKKQVTYNDLLVLTALYMSSHWRTAEATNLYILYCYTKCFQRVYPHSDRDRTTNEEFNWLTSYMEWWKTGMKITDEPLNCLFHLRVKIIVITSWNVDTDFETILCNLVISVYRIVLWQSRPLFVKLLRKYYAYILLSICILFDSHAPPRGQQQECRSRSLPICLYDDDVRCLIIEV